MTFGRWGFGGLVVVPAGSLVDGLEPSVGDGLEPSVVDGLSVVVVVVVDVGVDFDVVGTAVVDGPSVVVVVVVDGSFWRSFLSNFCRDASGSRVSLGCMTTAEGLSSPSFPSAGTSCSGSSSLDSAFSIEISGIDCCFSSSVSSVLGSFGIGLSAPFSGSFGSFDRPTGGSSRFSSSSGITSEFDGMLISTLVLGAPVKSVSGS